MLAPQWVLGVPQIVAHIGVGDKNHYTGVLQGNQLTSQRPAINRSNKSGNLITRERNICLDEKQEQSETA